MRTKFITNCLSVRYVLIDDLIIFSGFAIPLTFTVMILSTGREKVHDSIIWSFLTTYLLYSSVLLLIIVFSEITEFFGVVSIGPMVNDFHAILYLYVVLPLSVVIHAFGIYKLNDLFEYSIESVDLKIAGLPLVYSGLFWVIAAEITEYPMISGVMIPVSEIAYAISLPVLVVIIYFTIKEKKYEEAIIQSPIKSVDRIAGISMSFAIFSLAVMMKVYGHEDSYNILEAFALLTFVVSGELYRRTIFSLRKIF